MLLFAGMLPAQLLVVDPNGSGTYTDLQTAIQAAPPGAVIHVIGGTWGPLSITRSVTIVGQNQPRIRAPLWGFGSQPPAITLQGTGTESVVLARLDISGQCDGSWWNTAGPALAGAGFARIAIHDCTVHAHDWISITGSADSARGIAITGNTTLHVVRSSVRASHSYAAADDYWAPSGAPAIDAPGATVVLLDSTVTGGQAGSSIFTFAPPAPTPCPCGASGQEPGRGGVGVRAAILYVAGGAIQGGAGSPVFVGPPALPSLTPWGDQPDGAPVLAAVQATFATTLTQTAPLRLGSVHALGFAPALLPSLLALGRPAPWPMAVAGVQFVCVDLATPIVLHTLPAGASSYALAVPSTVGLLGYELAEQRFELAPGGMLLASNPVFGVVTP